MSHFVEASAMALSLLSPSMPMGAVPQALYPPMVGSAIACVTPKDLAYLILTKKAHPELGGEDLIQESLWERRPVACSVVQNDNDWYIERVRSVAVRLDSSDKPDIRLLVRGLYWEGGKSYYTVDSFMEHPPGK